VRENWGQLHNKELQDLYSFLDFLWGYQTGDSLAGVWYLREGNNFLPAGKFRKKRPDGKHRVHGTLVSNLVNAVKGVRGLWGVGFRYLLTTRALV